MWPAIQRIIVYFFGDEIVKYVLWSLAGLFCFIFIEVLGAQQSIFDQPFGQWWMAGQFGAHGTQVTSGSSDATLSSLGGGDIATLTLSPTDKVSDVDRYRLSLAAGWRGENAITATAVSFAENDQGIPAAEHINGDGSIDLGLWQMNSGLKPFGSAWAEFGGHDVLIVPQANANAAYTFWTRRGFEPWTMFRNGAYKSQLSRAMIAASQVNAVQLPPSSVNADQVIRTGMGWLGVHYLWGGCSRNGIDCSCFLQTIVAAVGIHAPRTTVEQVKWTTPVPLPDLQPGNFVYFNDTCTNCGSNPTHVGMYIGDGKMIDAGGDRVQINDITTGFYAQHYASAGKVPGL